MEKTYNSLSVIFHPIHRLVSGIICQGKVIANVRIVRQIEGEIWL